MYVDDRCSINELKEAFVGKLKAHYNNKPCELDFLNWELPEAVLRKKSQNYGMIRVMKKKENYT